MSREQTGPAARGETEIRRLRQGALTRVCRIYRPTGPARRPGLVILLHGAIGSGDEMAVRTGFDRQAERYGWIAAYPDAHNPGPAGGWGAHACCAQAGVDDVAFIRDLIGELEQRDDVDADRVYVAGFSRGAMMAYRLGCELADRISAIAAVAGNMADWHGSVEATGCRPSRPVSVLMIHGTSDGNVPIEGGTSADELAYFRERFGPEVSSDSLIAYAPLENVVDYWRVLNHCEESEALEVSPPVTIRRWDAPLRVAVELRLITGGTHCWPGPSQGVGSPDASIDASEVILEFFASHPRLQ